MNLDWIIQKSDSATVSRIR